MRANAFGARLREIRTHRNMTQAALAEAIGVSRPTICGWDLGRAQIAVPHLAAMAEVLAVPVQAFFMNSCRVDEAEWRLVKTGRKVTV